VSWALSRKFTGWPAPTELSGAGTEESPIGEATGKKAVALSSNSPFDSTNLIVKFPSAEAPLKTITLREVPMAWPEKLWIPCIVTRQVARSVGRGFGGSALGVINSSLQNLPVVELFKILRASRISSRSFWNQGVCGRQYTNFGISLSIMVEITVTQQAKQWTGWSGTPASG
jgi:hypothetical protein